MPENEKDINIQLHPSDRHEVSHNSDTHSVSQGMQESGGISQEERKADTREKDNNGNDDGDYPVSDISDTGLLTFVHKKTERLAHIIYILTDLMPDREPLKWSLRDVHTRMVSDIVHARYATTGRAVSSYVLETALAALSEMIALIDLAERGQWISQMNAGVLREEYIGLRNTLIERGHTGEPLKHIVLSDTYLERARHASTAKERTEGTGIPHAWQRVIGETHPSEGRTDAFAAHGTYHSGRGKGANDDKGVPEKAKGGREEGSSEGRPRTEEGTAGTEGASTKPARHAPSRSSSSGAKGQKDTAPDKKPRKAQVKNERKETILQVLRNRSDLTIKEVAAHLSGVSEKTVQRELNALIAAGEVHRKGARRWSRYRIAE